ncbi:MAG: LytR/AlgR family response regulator transcription factor [Luteibaculum sp.]
MNTTDLVLLNTDPVLEKDLSIMLGKYHYDILDSFSAADHFFNRYPKSWPGLMIIKYDSANPDFSQYAHFTQDQKRPGILLLVSGNTLPNQQLLNRFNPDAVLSIPFKELDLILSAELALMRKNERSKNKGFKEITRKKIDVDRLFIRDKSKYNRVLNEDILFVEALKDYVVFTTTKGNLTIHTTMKELESKLPSQFFFRVHRSYIINLSKIKNLDYSEIELEEGERKIPIGGSYRDKLQEKLLLI